MWFFIILYIVLAIVNLAGTFIEAYEERNRYDGLTRREVIEYSIQGFFSAFLPLADVVFAICVNGPTIWKFLCKKAWMNKKVLKK